MIRAAEIMRLSNWLVNKRRKGGVQQTLLELSDNMQFLLTILKFCSCNSDFSCWRFQVLALFDLKRRL